MIIFFIFLHSPMLSGSETNFPWICKFSNFEQEPKERGKHSTRLFSSWKDTRLAEKPIN